jgi:hypothetical protein
MKLIAIGSLVLTIFATPAGELTQDIKEAKIKIDLPNKLWALADKQSNNDVTVYYFKREFIEDEDGRKIIPNIGVVVEDVENDLDVVIYSAAKRAKINFEVSEVYTSDGGKIGFANAIGYKGKYNDNRGLAHTIYVVHGVNGNKGFQVICDATTSVADKVEGEFLASLKSLRK